MREREKFKNSHKEYLSKDFYFGLEQFVLWPQAIPIKLQAPITFINSHYHALVLFIKIHTKSNFRSHLVSLLYQKYPQKHSVVRCLVFIYSNQAPKIGLNVYVSFGLIFSSLSPHCSSSSSSISSAFCIPSDNHYIASQRIA